MWPFHLVLNLYSPWHPYFRIDLCVIPSAFILLHTPATFILSSFILFFFHVLNGVFSFAVSSTAQYSLPAVMQGDAWSFFEPLCWLHGQRDVSFLSIVALHNPCILCTVVMQDSSEACLNSHIYVIFLIT